MMRITDLEKPPKIGEIYLVPCVENVFYGDTLPVHNNLHADPDLNATEPHYHYDVRFLLDEEIAYITRGIRPSGLKKVAHVVALFQFLNPEMEPENSEEFVISWEPRKCLRIRYPHFDFGNLSADGQELHSDFRAFYAGQSIGAEEKCPHRGHSLKQVPCRKDGTKKCPLHGLVFRDGVAMPSPLSCSQLLKEIREHFCLHKKVTGTTILHYLTKKGYTEEYKPHIWRIAQGKAITKVDLPKLFAEIQGDSPAWSKKKR